MKKVYVIKTGDDGTIAVATNKKEVVNIIKKYVEKCGNNLKLMNLVEGGNGELIRNERAKWDDLKFVETNNKAYWNKVYTNLCKQLRDEWFAYFELLFIRGEKENYLNSWDSISIDIQDFETNKLNGEKRNG